MRGSESIDGTGRLTRHWAALLAIHSHIRFTESQIEVAAFPLLGMGFGGMSYSEAVKQMAAAYRHFS